MSEEGNSRGVMIGMFAIAISQTVEGKDASKLTEYLSTGLEQIGEKPLTEKEQGAVYAVLGKVLLHIAKDFEVSKP